MRFLPFVMANAMAIASAAAVPSSNKEALAICIEVRDITIVWKLTNDSRRPVYVLANDTKILKKHMFYLGRFRVGRECRAYTKPDFQ